ncbi:glutaredoxin family protein [Calidithermus timidus]|jgi:mycoredoxin|uniref:glutaredoxin family protein n=1 Tax=Calidithermus timidus TaxID=307124 RepID=UPI00037CE6C4|nr:glutaredoxin family protein [Calidithermus timidus]
MITMYSTAWCPDCKATKMALERFGLSYIEINIDQHPEGERLVLEANGGRRSVPTLVYAGQVTSMSRFSVAKLQEWLEQVGLLEAARN